MAQFSTKTLDQIRSDYLGTYGNELIRRGVANPNVSNGTEIYVRATALATQLAVIYSQLPAAADSLLPDTAQGQDLIRLAALRKLSLRPAGPSTGSIDLVSSVSPILIPTGSQLLDPAGLSYKVSVGGTYSLGQPVPIISISVGSATRLPAGTILKWTSPPAFASTTQPVSAGGLTGGNDAETLEGLRSRLLDDLQDPKGGGNSAQMNGWAEDSSTAVQKAFTYPCYQGPDTALTCPVRAPTSSNKGRTLDSLVLATTVKPAVIAQLPSYAAVDVVGSTDVDLDVAIGLSLPDSKAASGPGGGWTDATPWPTKASPGYAAVTSVTSTTSFSVDADVIPTAGVTQIAWLSPLDWKVYQGTVQTASGVGPFAITLDVPFIGITAGHVISPNAQNIAVYFQALLDFFAQMGPGQITTVPGLLPRGYRSPLVQTSWPCDPTPQMLRAIELSGDEVEATSFLYRSATTCPVPSDPTSGPNIFTPRNCGFYPI